MKIKNTLYKTMLILVMLAGSIIASPIAAAFQEGWETSTAGTYLPTTHDSLPLPFISADEGEWLLGDTVSEFPECGATPHTAEIIQAGGNRLLRLTSNDSGSSCADNIDIGLFEIPALTVNSGFSVPLSSGTNISFEETGNLINPETGSHSCIGPPCGDAISLTLVDNRGNQLAYVLQRAPNSVPNVSHSVYREIFLDPTAGTYTRDLYSDFSTIPDFNPNGAEIVLINFSIDEHGSANIDNICIGTSGCGEFQLVIIPDVTGLTQANAEADITASGLIVGDVTFQSSDTVPSGKVINQAPVAGGQVVRGTEVDLTVSTGVPISADFSATPVIGSAPLTVNFSDESTANITSWRWDFGDGTTSTSQHPTHIYLNWGRYRVSLTVTGPGGRGFTVKDDYITVLPDTTSVIVPDIAAGFAHTLALNAGGIPYAWGYNGYGQVGDGTTTWRMEPVQVSGLSNVVSVSAGENYSLALRKDGTVWSWGRNFHGALGDGTTIDRHMPVQVSNLSNVVAIAAGGIHSMAIKSDGTLWAWGDNRYGQLGDGSTTDSYTPIQVNGMNGVTGIASGLFHSLVIKSDGTAWAWGENDYGQLGDGTITDRLAPVQVSGISDVVSIGVSTFQSTAVMSNGTLWAWGENSTGQLGDGTTTNQHSPVQITSISGVTDVVRGAYYTVALKADGTLWSWGDNKYGQLGDGSTTFRQSPIQVSGISNVIQTTTGYAHTAALLSDGNLWIWGRSGWGQLGIGPTTIDQLLPVQVHGLDGVGYLNLLNIPDSDSDGLPDYYEELYTFLDPLNGSDAALDQDNDGLTNLREYLAGTIPDDADSDNDGIPDGYEAQFNFLSPLDDTDAALDEDGDGFSNLQEFLASSDPGDPGSKPRQVNIMLIITPLLLP